MDIPAEELRKYASEFSPPPNEAVAAVSNQPTAEQPRKRLCIAVMAYDSKGYWRTFMSLMQAVAKCGAQGWDVTYTLREGDSMVARGRSLLASRFLLDPALADCTDLIMVDADLYWDGDEFIRIMSHDVDVVAGAYPYKNDQGNFPLRWLSTGVFEENGLWVVQAVTPGFLRIRRPALIRMVNELPWLAVRDDNDSGQMWMFFDNLARQNGVYDEGYVFCERWRMVGGTVYLDPDLEFTHIGTKAFKHGTIRQWMDRKSTQVADLNKKYPHVSPMTLFNKTMGKDVDLDKEEAEAVAKSTPAYALEGSELYVSGKPALSTPIEGIA